MKTNNFYVYTHRRVSDGIVFYVGKGTGPRALRFSNRGSKYEECLKDSGGIQVDKIAENLFEDEALELEHYYINNPPVAWKLINTLSNSRTKTMDLQDIRSKLKYDPNSPSFLTWKISVPFSKCKEGDIAGWHSSADNYYRVQVNGKIFLAHRVVWYLFNDNQDENLVINHIDNNRTNNNINNLECISKEHNSLKNKSLNKNGLRPNNTSGYNNIREVSTGDGILARVSSEKYKRISKYFSYSKYTKEDAMKLAIEWYEEKQKEILNLRLQS
jgi:hypothetical protein